MFPSAPSRRRSTASETTIVHFDYDCFYASVFENESPHLKTLPLAVQQKQIVVTCNYVARKRGLHKLQLITDAKRICPDLVIVLGEDLTRFRNASKELYAFFKSFSWNARCERLGFDEVFMDVSDIVEYNASILSAENLSNSFFCLSKTDPTVGFAFDASKLAGNVYPATSIDTLDTATLDCSQLRMLLASHLALYLRTRLESDKGYTATVGISTNKVLAKMVGTQHKPNGQTTLWQPYTSDDGNVSTNVAMFMDNHEIGRVPGIGFKIAQKLRAHVLQRPADFDAGLVYGGTKENVSVRQVRQYPGMSPATLERLLGGAGAPYNIGLRIWELLNGRDNTEVGEARQVPTQIGIEDSYLRLDTLSEVTKELRMLATSLLNRMHTDLVEHEEDSNHTLADSTTSPPPSCKRWLAHPKTIRLSTRPRPPLNRDGTRNRSFARISRSAPMPSFVFSFKDAIEAIVERLLTETLVPLFRRLHPEKSGWNLSLVNIAAANMVDAASEKGGVGRDIAKMFRRQDVVLRQWRVDEDEDGEDERGGVGREDRNEQVKRDEEDHGLLHPQFVHGLSTGTPGSEDVPTSSQQIVVSEWVSEGEDVGDSDLYACEACGALMPLFAQFAHERFHAYG